MRVAVRHLVSRLTLRIGALTLALLLTGAVLSAVGRPVLAANLNVRELRLQTPLPSDTGIYLFSVGYVTASSIESIRFEICANDPFIGTPCTPPAGLDATGAALVNQTGETGFSIDPSSTANVIVLTRSAAVVTPGTSTYEFDQIINPSAAATYYVRMETFVTPDASGPNTDEGALAFSINPAFSVSAEVPPYLEFCTGITITLPSCASAAGNQVNFGELSRTQTRSGSSQFMATTNASFGYSVTMAGSTMTAGNDVIPPMTGGASVPGISQFGVNMRANTIPPVGGEPEGIGSATVTAGYSQPNRYRFNSGDIVALSPGSNDYQKFTASYIVNVSAEQPPGSYASTISYICLANF